MQREGVHNGFNSLDAVIVFGGAILFLWSLRFLSLCSAIHDIRQKKGEEVFALIG
jgi:hypothetical protein